MQDALAVAVLLIVFPLILLALILLEALTQRNK